MDPIMTEKGFNRKRITVILSLTITKPKKDRKNRSEVLSSYRVEKSGAPPQVRLLTEQGNTKFDKEYSKNVKMPGKFTFFMLNLGQKVLKDLYGNNMVIRLELFPYCVRN
jgi:hypothetical protein